MALWLSPSWVYTSAAYVKCPSPLPCLLVPLWLVTFFGWCFTTRSMVSAIGFVFLVCDKASREPRELYYMTPCCIYDESPCYYRLWHSRHRLPRISGVGWFFPHPIHATPLVRGSLSLWFQGVSKLRCDLLANCSKKKQFTTLLHDSREAFYIIQCKVRGTHRAGG